MKCPNCGTENPDGARFCKNCGYQLQSGTTPPPPPGEMHQPPPPPQSQPAPPPPPPSGGTQQPYTQPTAQPTSGEKESWWNSLIFCLLLSIFCCWPLGVILYWMNPVASKKSKIIFTAVFVALFLLGLLVWFILMLKTGSRASVRF